MLKKTVSFLKKSETAKSGLWYLISNFALNGMAFITVPIFTRLLSVEDYGTVSVYMSIVAVMTIVSGLDLHIGIGRAIIDFDRDYQKYLSSVLSLSIVLFLVGILLLFAFLERASKWFEMTPDLLLFAFVTGYGSFVFGFYQHNLIFMRKYRQKSLLDLIKAISEVALAIIMILLMVESKYYGRVYSHVVISMVFMVICFVMIFRGSKTTVCPKAWLYAIRIGIPLVPHSLSGIILVQFDRVAIKSLVGATEAGLYSFAYNLGMIPLIFLTASSHAWAPWSYTQLSHGNYSRIRKAANLYSFAFLLIVLGTMMLGPEMAIALAPQEYLGGVRLISVIALGYFFQFSYTIYVNFAFYMKKTFAISIGTIMAGGINIALNLLMIPVFGYEIAAWTTVISYFCLFVFHWFNVSVLLKEKTVEFRAMIAPAIIASVIAFQQYITLAFLRPFSLIERLLRFGILGLTCLVLVAYILKTARTMMTSNKDLEGG